MPRVSFDARRSPVHRAMQVALGIMGWSPDAFWRATPAELLAAVRGWQEKSGLIAGGAPPSEDEIARLKELLNGHSGFGIQHSGSSRSPNPES